MLIQVFLDFSLMIVDLIFAILPDVPNIEIGLLSSLNNFVNLIFDNLQLLGFFIDINMIKTLLPYLIIVINIEHIYHFVMWVLNKIPFVDID